MPVVRRPKKLFFLLRSRVDWTQPFAGITGCKMVFARYQLPKRADKSTAVTSVWGCGEAIGNK